MRVAMVLCLGWFAFSAAHAAEPAAQKQPEKLSREVLEALGDPSVEVKASQAEGQIAAQGLFEHVVMARLSRLGLSVVRDLPPELEKLAVPANAAEAEAIKLARAVPSDILVVYGVALVNDAAGTSCRTTIQITDNITGRVLGAAADSGLLRTTPPSSGEVNGGCAATLERALSTAVAALRDELRAQARQGRLLRIAVRNPPPDADRHAVATLKSLCVSVEAAPQAEKVLPELVFIAQCRPDLRTVSAALDEVFDREYPKANREWVSRMPRDLTAVFR